MISLNYAKKVLGGYVLNFYADSYKEVVNFPKNKPYKTYGLIYPGSVITVVENGIKTNYVLTADREWIELSLNNYTQIEEVKELPNLDYTGEVYFSGSLTDEVMNSLGITENPVDINIFAQTMLGEPDAYVVIVKSYNDLPKEGDSYAFYLILDDSKAYIYNENSKKYNDVTEQMESEGIVYIGTDKSVIGTMDVKQDDPEGTVGLYIIIQEPEKVSTSTIYKKEIMTEGGAVNTNYVFGEKIDMITVDNTNSTIEKVNQILTSKGFDEEMSQNISPVLISYGLASENLDFIQNGNDRVLFVNMYDNGKYIFKNNILSELLEQTEPIEKEFNTIDELYNFINNLYSEISNKVPEFKEMIDTLTANNLEYKYTNEPLNDSNLFLNVVEGPIEPKGTGVYQYYIYNGKEYIELGGKGGGATENIVKEINITSLSIKEAVQQMKTITFTKEEAIKLSTTSNLIILTNIDDGNSIKVQVVNYFYNKQVITNDIGVVIIFTDLYYLVLEEVNLFISIQQDNQDTNLYKLSASSESLTYIERLSLSSTDWTEDTTYSVYGYNYKAEVVTDALYNYITSAQVNVIFGIKEAVSGNFAPYVKVENGKFTLYAKEKPTEDITFDFEVVSR